MAIAGAIPGLTPGERWLDRPYCHDGRKESHGHTEEGPGHAA